MDPQKSKSQTGPRPMKGTQGCRNLVPKVLSCPPYGARERQTLENIGHMSRIWKITSKRFGEGAGKCEIYLYRG